MFEHAVALLRNLLGHRPDESHGAPPSEPRERPQPSERPARRLSEPVETVIS
jgi:hypothetical protein